MLLTGHKSRMDAIVPIVLGVFVGLGGAVATTRIIESVLFETAPLDPTTCAAVGLVMAATGGLAAFIPARRVTRVDPVALLRAE